MHIKKELVSWEKTDGWIYHWLICGFFDAGLHGNTSPTPFDSKVSDNWDKDLLPAWGGESGIVDVPETTGHADVEWLPVSLCYGPRLTLKEQRERYSDLDGTMGKLDSDGWDKIWYALAVIESEAEVETTIRFCGWDGCKLFVNGEELFEEHSYHHTILEKECVSVHLKKGLNTLLFKLDRDGCAARIEPTGDTKLCNVTTAEPRERNPIATIQQLKTWAMQKEVTNPFTGTTPEQLQSWQDQFRPFYHSCVGPFPEIPDGDTELVSTETTDDDIERRLYHMPSEAGFILPFYVMIPTKDKRNGKWLTIAHGHAKTWNEVAGIERKEKDAGSTLTYTGDYGYQLALHGFITCVCCERGFAERNDYRGTHDKCTYAAMLAMSQGCLYPALQMHDIRRMTSFVGSLPEAQGFSGPGLTGLSGGGTMTYLLGAYDDTYKACATFCGMCRYRDYAMGAGCGMQIIPNLFPTGDVGELLSLIAPRPFLAGQGRLDATFNVVTTRSIVADAQRAYNAAGCPDSIRLAVYELAHQVDIEEAARFFEEVL